MARDHSKIFAISWIPPFMNGLPLCSTERPLHSHVSINWNSSAYRRTHMMEIGNEGQGTTPVANYLSPMSGWDWIGSNHRAKLHAGQCVYTAIAVAAANPPQPEHCHHASVDVRTFPVTIQLNAGRDEPEGKPELSAGLPPRALNASATDDVETPRNSWICASLHPEARSCSSV